MVLETGAAHDRATIFIGEDDEAIDVRRLRTLINRKSPAIQFEILPDVNHFAIFTSGSVHKILIEWLGQCAELRPLKDSIEVVTKA